MLWGLAALYFILLILVLLRSKSSYLFLFSLPLYFVTELTQPGF